MSHDLSHVTVPLLSLWGLEKHGRAVSFCPLPYHYLRRGQKLCGRLPRHTGHKTWHQVGSALHICDKSDLLGEQQEVGSLFGERPLRDSHQQRLWPFLQVQNAALEIEM